LQIGSLGATGFNGNDIAIGNGSQAMVMFQSNSNITIASTTDIILNPRNNGHGRVGINTNTPRAPLDVVDFVGTFSGYDYLNGSSSTNGIGDCSFCTAAVSIYASNAVLASEFDAFSDARIKNVVGRTNSKKDLETINALQITDYTMKDIIKNGTKPYKKVIAQEVEKVYPQVVSRHVDFIPNVYQTTEKIEKTKDGYLLSFKNKHHISDTAKMLRVLISAQESMQDLNILSIPSDYQVLIQVTALKSEKMFVYGEQVNDFRTVDYEGLITLNISATQELGKMIDAQNKIIRELSEEIKLLKQKN
jgi:hypothetical protein